MWKIKQIFDGDYGCEERQPGEKIKVSVTLVNQNDIEKIIFIEDDWLQEKGLDTGDIWPENYKQNKQM